MISIEYLPNVKRSSNINFKTVFEFSTLTKQSWKICKRSQHFFQFSRLTDTTADQGINKRYYSVKRERKKERARKKIQKEEEQKKEREEDRQ